ncbi:peroxiredoxin-like family protein [Halanaerobium sp. ST460_2HS_T2]|uniref:peroxiredoxin-like family protein n=1 Tax=Halanaerobium sp. ST460_2HS_T2 TaxID=2183914 RepID=UPI000DF3397C|nr:peroxiredoxin-like family protein [Halanaerobium sp. ST460_2HS_T2]RCW52094.1 peroxiredoxin [Halanaerobium sp. ST460_2HS_T2]
MIKNLQEELNRLGKNNETPAEIQQKIAEANQKLEESGEVDGLKVGDRAPNFKLRNHLSEEVSLVEELKKGPVVLVFYRGGWCPYCNLQLKAYQKALPEIKEKGAQLIAVSPQTPDNTLSQKEKEELEFELLSDQKGETAANYEVLFEVPAVVKELYQNFGLDLAEYNGLDEWILPVPAVYIINQEGKIEFVDLNVDYTVRTEPQTIIDNL